MTLETPKAQQLQAWFATARPTPDDAFGELDDARARGEITREEYLVLLDAEI